MATINAASCSYADVSAAITAASDGDTVIVPAGTATWTSRLHITKSIYLIGAGIGVTTITSGFSSGGASSVDPVNNFISWVPASPASNPPFRLSGFTINFGSGSHGLLLRNTSAYDCTKIRIDHCNLMGIAQTKFVFDRYGLVHGVMDNCTIYGSQGGAGMATLWNTNAFEFGSASQFYMEDCDIYTSYGSADGAFRYAVRYCNIYPTSWDSSQIFEHHGNQTGQASCYGVEIYNNYVDTSAVGPASFVVQRGGKDLIYNNTFVNADTIRTREEHQDSLGPPTHVGAPYASYGINLINSQPYHPSDTYVWNNRVISSNALIHMQVSPATWHMVCNICGLDVPQENVTFWNHNESFNGSTGMGVGLLAARPSSGLTVGVGYWATDTNTLYRATGATTWETYYTPYTYPHPLRGSTYYVDKDHPSASDSNTGTDEDLPWATITKANATLTAGDTVYIKAGTYSGQYIAPANSGTAINRITYSAYGSDTVTVTGPTYAIYMSGKSYITITGIDFSTCDRFIYLTGSSNNIISYCNFDQVSGSRSAWDGSALVGSSQYNWIHHCQFSKYGEVISSDDRGACLAIGTEGSLTDQTWYNVVEDCTLFHGGHHVLGIYGMYNVVRNNYFHNEDWMTGAGDRGTTTYGNRNVVIFGYVSNCGRNLFEGNRVGYSGDPPDAVGSVGMMLLASYNIVRYNKFYYNDRAGLSFQLTSSYYDDILYNKVYNNTFFHNAVHAGASSENCAMYFVIYSGTHVIENNDIRNNLFYSHPDTFEADGAASLNDQIFTSNYDGDVSGDPLFISAPQSLGDPTDSAVPNLDLDPDSFCVNAGTYLTLTSNVGVSSTTLTVDDAGYFQDGSWGASGVTLEADWIAVGTVDNVAQISSINYSTNTITLASALSWSNDASVWLYKNSSGTRVLYGTAPNIGAYENPLEDSVTGFSNSEEVRLIIDADEQAKLVVEYAKRRAVAGTSVTYVVSASAFNGFTGNITLDVTGLPTNATDSYSVNPISETGTSTVTVTTTDVTPGTYNMYITGTSAGGDVASIRVVLEVVAAADGDIKVPFRYIRAKQGDNAVYTINADSLSGYTSDIDLSVSGVPSGASSVFGDASLAYNGSTTLTIDTGTAAVGTYDLIITGEGPV